MISPEAFFFAVIGGDNVCHINSQMTFNILTDADR